MAEIPELRAGGEMLTKSLAQFVDALNNLNCQGEDHRTTLSVEIIVYEESIHLVEHKGHDLEYDVFLKQRDFGYAREDFIRLLRKLRSTGRAKMDLNCTYFEKCLIQEEGSTLTDTVHRSRGLCEGEMRVGKGTLVLDFKYLVFSGSEDREYQ